MSSNSTNRGYILQTSGENPGTWGLNPGLNGSFQTIDTNLGGVTNVALTNSNVTLSSTQYANGTVRLTGTLTGSVQVIFPAVQGWWTIDNQTTGLFNAVISIGSGQVICVEQGSAADILIDGTNVKFRNLPPVGTYLDVIDSTVPAWITACTVPPYLLCDGSVFSAVTYPYLNTKLGGTTLPDLRGRVRAYLNGGTARITTAGSGIDGNTRLSAGGAETVTIVTANLPAYTPSGTLGNFVLNMPTRNITTDTASVPIVTNTLANTTGNQNIFTYFGGSTLTGTFTGTAQGGTSTAVNKMPPACIGGITLIRSA